MTLANPARPFKPHLLLVTDETRMPDPLAAIRRLPAGSGIIFRHYGYPDRAALCLRIARLAKARRLVLLVAGDWRLAAKVGAAGVHLPEGQLRSGRLAALRGWAKGRLITAACHHPAALNIARVLGASAAILSPVFPTASHPGARSIGALRFRMWSRQAGLPVIAMGGMSAGRLRDTKAAGFAAVGAFC